MKKLNHKHAILAMTLAMGFGLFLYGKDTIYKTVAKETGWKDPDELALSKNCNKFTANADDLVSDHSMVVGRLKFQEDSLTELKKSLAELVETGDIDTMTMQNLLEKDIAKLEEEIEQLKTIVKTTETLAQETIDEAKKYCDQL